ncbi:MAG: phage/plasmid primase, P4 family [Acidimicrobiales bacterium]
MAQSSSSFGRDAWRGDPDSAEADLEEGPGARGPTAGGGGLVPKAPGSLFDAALSYASSGLAVFPVHGFVGGRCTCGDSACSRPAKHPIAELVPHGFKGATTDAALIREWWGRFPAANIGAPVGRGVAVVLDVDPRHGGRESLAALVHEHGHLPKGPATLTGGGGDHFWFSHPGGSVPPAHGFLPGLDLQADGSYVLLPPSVHASGSPYRWAVALGTGLPLLPAWLFRSAIEVKRPRSQAAAVGSLIPSGMRNSTLASIAGRLRSAGASGSAILADLREQNSTRCDPPLPDSEVVSISRSIGRYEAPSHPPVPPTAPGDDPTEIYDLTELGNADRFVDRFGSEVRYDCTREGWLVWDTHRWGLDETGQAYRQAERVVDAIHTEAAQQDGTDLGKELLRWWRSSSTDRRIKAVLEVSSHREGVPVVARDLDRDPWIITCLNGTLDLRTGEIREPRQSDLITTLCPVEYRPEATCPKWETFLLEAMAGDKELVGFLQRAVGYSLTGSTREQVFFLLYGTGNNGKSTFLNRLRGVFGDNSQNLESKSFLSQKSDRVRQDLANLRGARLVTTSEIEDGDQLDEDLVKRLTGGDPITARWLFARRETEFTPTLKLWMAVNHKPRIWGQDEGIWRRVRMIPWLVTVPPDRVDKEFGARLDAEREGIFAWMVRGALEYQKHGLIAPQSVTDATKEYREESDILFDFVKECTEKSKVGGPSLPVGDLYRAYCGWSRDAGDRRPLSAKGLGMRLRERGWKQDRNMVTRYWTGVTLTPKGLEYSDRPVREEFGASGRRK